MDMEFWRLPTVMEKVGLSRTEIYRRIERGEFPKSRPYPRSTKRFWVAQEVREWQAKALGADEFQGLLG